MRPRTDSLLDTIAALATPVGRSALALLRISGPETRRILAAAAPDLDGELPPRHPRLVSFVDTTGEVLDRGLATFFPAPASATGEDVGELSVHGSPVVVERLLALLCAAGARLAQPGEFTQRAYLSGKIDLVEAEATRDLIEARTPAAARASARRLEGRLSVRLEKVREDLLCAAAQLAATIDFSEDVGSEIPAQALSSLTRAQSELARLAQTFETGRLLSAGCRVALLGSPNVGKSTLFNGLVGSARAIVTEIPGTTRDTLEAAIDLGGVPVTVVDTAGLRETLDRVEKIGVERAREAGESADAVVYVFDAAAGWTDEDEAAAGALSERPVLVVANKIDRLAPGKNPDRGLPLCGLDAQASLQLRRALEQTVASRVATEESSEILGSLRQKDLVDRAGSAAAAALEAIARGDSPEYAATHVHEAIDALADLVGETTSEDVLQRIFATFCIGK
jgi:tRNA modification GTPase